MEQGELGEQDMAPCACLFLCLDSSSAAASDFFLLVHDPKELGVALSNMLFGMPISTVVFSAVGR